MGKHNYASAITVSQLHSESCYSRRKFRRIREPIFPILLSVIVSAALLPAQQRRDRPGREEPAAATPNVPAAAEAPRTADMPDEKPSVTHHKITVLGKTLQYIATAGRMPIKNEQGRTEAQIFHVAYTLDNSGPKRPLTIALNGGLGSTTVWLHMGCFGPKRVKMQPNGFMPPPPFELEDN
jgi:carboxypeptidase C (cathepsin A)